MDDLPDIEHPISKWMPGKIDSTLGFQSLPLTLYKKEEYLFNNPIRKGIEKLKMVDMAFSDRKRINSKKYCSSCCRKLLLLAVCEMMTDIPALLIMSLWLLLPTLNATDKIEKPDNKVKVSLITCQLNQSQVSLLFFDKPVNLSPITPHGNNSHITLILDKPLDFKIE